MPDPQELFFIFGMKLCFWLLHALAAGLLSEQIKLSHFILLTDNYYTKETNKNDQYQEQAQFLLILSKILSFSLNRIHLPGFDSSHTSIQWPCPNLPPWF